MGNTTIYKQKLHGLYFFYKTVGKKFIFVTCKHAAIGNNSKLQR